MRNFQYTKINKIKTSNKKPKPYKTQTPKIEKTTSNCTHSSIVVGSCCVFVLFARQTGVLNLATVCHYVGFWGIFSFPYANISFFPFMCGSSQCHSKPIFGVPNPKMWIGLFVTDPFDIPISQIIN